MTIESLELLIEDILQKYPNESFSKTADRILQKCDLFSHRTLRRRVAKVAKQILDEMIEANKAYWPELK